ncbi:MAG TPA: hypothetical protein VKZ53_27780 [Candidatus Angelobacter sp.]|nr:hypothetical protein [Candidatus Angelobacter sp.]
MKSSTERKKSSPAFTYQEACTILAALRVFQAHELTDFLPNDPFTRIRNMEHFDDCAPLTDEEIDELCDRIEIPPFPESGISSGPDLDG